MSSPQQKTIVLASGGVKSVINIRRFYLYSVENEYCFRLMRTALALVMVAGTCGYGEELSGSINAGNFLTSCKVYWLASQEGLCCME